VREVYNAEIPHYFRDLYDKGPQSVAPRVELAADLDTPNPRCVVSIVACTGDWTGGWDCTLPGGVDKFITADGQAGRMVEVIQRGEPAMILGHWTGVYFNGQELGLQILQEVVKRLHARFDNLIWMKLAELSRYWAARELTRIESQPGAIHFRAPYACSDFTVRLKTPARAKLRIGDQDTELREVPAKRLEPNTISREGDRLLACLALPKGESTLVLSTN
jgi:hypothetical protein